MATRASPRRELDAPHRCRTQPWRADTGGADAVFAGLFARIESAHGNALGLPTPQMYANFARDRSPLHDFSVAPDGDYYNYRCPTPGWTACYGWGSLDIGRFNDYVTTYGACRRDARTSRASPHGNLATCLHAASEAQASAFRR